MCAREEEKEKGRWSGGEQVNDCSEHCETQIISLPLQLQQCQSSISRHHSTQGIQLHGHGVALHCQLKLALLKQHVALFGRKITLISSSTQSNILYCTFSFSNKASCFLLSSSKTSSSSSSSLPEELWTSYSTSSHAFSYITKTDCVTRWKKADNYCER